MIAKLLCWMGLHDWHIVDWWSGKYGEMEEWEQAHGAMCFRCRKAIDTRPGVELSGAEELTDDKAKTG